MSTAVEKKGINFRQTPQGQLMLVEPDTFMEYIKSLPRNERGWIEFRYDAYKNLNKRNAFATVHPIKK